mmetsp:Transcript_9115/g.22542  ORF Transcript_9115/g.22542 Transcript_9115/m.22542 type:complete len:229 (-) Transcript_9115:98-784(-)
MVDYIQVRLCHAVMMTLAWVGFHTLGCVFGKWLKDERELGSFFGTKPRERRLTLLFRSHYVSQALGLALGTAGFILCLQTFQIPYKLIQHKHGSLGIAVMTLAYVQGLMGVLRPAASAGDEAAATMATAAGPKSEGKKNRLRTAFEFAHGALGRVTLVLGLVNCFTGLALMRGIVEDSAIEAWAAICVAWILGLFVADGVADKVNKAGLAARARGSIRESELTASTQA